MILTNLTAFDLIFVVVTSTVLGNCMSAIIDSIVECLMTKKSKKGEKKNEGTD